MWAQDFCTLIKVFRLRLGREAELPKVKMAFHSNTNWEWFFSANSPGHLFDSVQSTLMELKYLTLIEQDTQGEYISFLNRRKKSLIKRLSEPGVLPIFSWGTLLSLSLWKEQKITFVTFNWTLRYWSLGTLLFGSIVSERSMSYLRSSPIPIPNSISL